VIDTAPVGIVADHGTAGRQPRVRATTTL